MVTERAPAPHASSGDDDSSPRGGTHHVVDAVIVLTVVLGAALRLRQYFFARSFWYDELFIASNVRERGFVGLTRKLSFSQAAPLGFLWSAKASTEAFGQSELAYRLVPVVAGILTVVCVALVARRAFTPAAAIAATATIAVAGQSIRYSSEFKQYSMEAAVAAGLLLVASHCVGHTLSERPRRPALLAVAGALALTCSISAVFVLAGIAIVLVVEVVRSRSYAHYLSALWIALTWAAAAAVMYLVSWSKDARNTGLHDYWKPYFGPAPWLHPSWYVSSWTTMIKSQLAISWSWAALALTVVGLASLGRHAPALATIAVVTVLSTWVASWAGVYPVDGRLLLFLVPTVCLLLGAAVDAFVRLVVAHPPQPRFLVACLGAVALASGSIDTAVATARHPFQLEETRQALEALRPRFRPGDRLFVTDQAALGFLFYRDRTGFASVQEVLGRVKPDRVPAYLREIRALGPGRTWILFGRVRAGSAYEREALYIPKHVKGRIIATIRETGVWAVEVEQVR